MEQRLLMNEKNNYENQLAIIQGENINVSSSNDAKDFLILLAGFAVVILLFIFSFDIIASFFIDRMSVETQLKIESLFSFNFYSPHLTNSDKQLQYLNRLKQKIINNDVNLQNKSKFPVSIIQTDTINAMIAPNGSIYFTKGLLDMNLSEQELAFVMAHELGHYVHRDHLKTISKQIAIVLVCSIFSQDKAVNSVTSGITQMEALKHSRNQERNADLYASRMLIKLYGTNSGGKNFIKRLQKKENSPEFLYYFSTHPSWKERLRVIDSQQ